MKIAVFGTGYIYEANKKRLDRLDEITAFLDNDMNKQGKLLMAYVFIRLVRFKIWIAKELYL